MSEAKCEAEAEKNRKSNSVLEDEWLIRPCHIYEEEYSDCTSIRARFNQYFIFGKPLDCLQWRRDCDNCYKWEDNKDVKAGQEIVDSEKARRLERLGAHHNNNVWERRESPPENWNSPLPDYIQKEYDASYLNLKSKELKGEVPPTIDPADFCVIM